MDNICARDVMRRDVLIIREDALLHECAHLLCERRITGMPVVNAHGMLTGIVSQTDIVRHQDRLLAIAKEGSDPACVRDVMTRHVACAGEDASLGSLMDLMMDLKIHRVIITSGSSITGIVSTMDIMALMVRASDECECSRPDYSNLYSNRHERLLLRQEHIERMLAIQKGCAARASQAYQDPLALSDIVNACLDFVFEHPVPFGKIKRPAELREMIFASVYQSLLLNAQAGKESFAQVSLGGGRLRMPRLPAPVDLRRGEGRARRGRGEVRPLRARGRARPGRVAGVGRGGGLIDPRPSIVAERLSAVAKIVPVTGGKVGLLDLDLSSPSQHTILGAQGRSPAEDRGILPPVFEGIRFLSLAFFTGDRPAPLRGAGVSNAIIELLAIMRWGEFDFLVVDMPPGHGDAALDVIRLMPRSESVPPSRVSFATVGKVIGPFSELGVRMTGVIEKMVRSESGCIREETARLGVPYLGAISFDPGLEEAIGDPRRGDAGAGAARRALAMSCPHSERRARFRGAAHECARFGPAPGLETG